MSRYYVLSLIPPFRQADGFFLREDEAVCFWPPSSKIGYVISDKPKTMEELFGKCTEKQKIIDRVFKLFSVLLLISIVTNFVENIYFLLLPLALSLAYILVKKFIDLKTASLLDSCPTVLHEKPMPIDNIYFIKSILFGSIANKIIIGFLYFVAIFGSFSFSLILLFGVVPRCSGDIYKYIFGILIGVGFFSVSAWLSFFIGRGLLTPFCFDDHVHPNADKILKRLRPWVTRLKYT